MRDELREASDAVLSSSTTDSYNALIADDWLGRILLMADQKVKAKRHIERLGRFADHEVWTIGPETRPRWNLGRTRMGLGLWP